MIKSLSHPDLHQSFPSPRKVASQGLRVLPTCETQVSSAGRQLGISESPGEGEGDINYYYHYYYY